MFTFLPKNLFEQFSRFANIYFLILGLLSMIPQISKSDGQPLIFIPLSFIILVTAIKDLYEDIKRSKSDKQENTTRTIKLVESGLQSVYWKDIMVGDIIKVNKNQFFPADILLIKSNNQNGLVYIETKNLDGETNMKHKKIKDNIFNLYQNMDDLSLFQQHQQIEYEKPNPFIYQFKGQFSIPNNPKELLDEKQIALRGCQLKNTEYVYGVVLYTGDQTKIMLNSVAARAKESNMMIKMNTYIFFIFILQIAICILCSVIHIIYYEVQKNNISYLKEGSQDIVTQFVLRFGNWLLNFSYFVPISLLVSLETVKYIQGYMIGQDYHFRSEKYKMNTEVQTSSLNEELGQIQYIFSDKTGTLTQNVMEFKMIDIKGKMYGTIPNSNDENINTDQFKLYPDVDKVDFNDQTLMELIEKQDESSQHYIDIREYIFHLGLCHTIMVTRNDGNIVYNAASPDEYALIQMAVYCGFIYQGTDTDGNMLLLDKRKKQTFSFKLLDVLEFNSTRKRMSVILKDNQTNQIKLYCKGADNIIMKRLNQESLNNFAKTDQNLQQFSRIGLRTLLLSQKKLTEEEYNSWKQKYIDAQQDLEQMEKKMDQLQEQIEVQMELIGATAIEDKLQDDVGDTIDYLKRAGIKVWVLTGDKQETAINIGYSCKLLDDGLIQMIINANSKESVKQQMNEIQIQFDDLDVRSQQSIINCDETDYRLTILEQRNSQEREYDIQLSDIKLNKQKSTRSKSSSKIRLNYALILSGDSFMYIDCDEMKKQLYDIAQCCEVVLACRVSPKQKADIVNIVKRQNKEAITLSIGDGANDVNMINAAHVGIGIKGVEGNQAARASDYSMGEFKFLKRLLLVKGREFYRRNSLLICFNFWKNIVLVMPDFWYGFESLFAGSTYYNIMLMELYNVIYCNLPILYFAIHDKEYMERILIKHPSYYFEGRLGLLFNRKIFTYWICSGFMYSLMVFLGFLSSFSVPYTQNGLMQFSQYTGILLLFQVVFLANSKVLIMSCSYTFVNIFLWIISNMSMYVCYVVSTMIIQSETYYGTRNDQFTYQFYMTLTILTAYSIIIDIVMSRYQQFLRINQLDEQDQQELKRHKNQLKTKEANQIYVRQMINTIQVESKGSTNWAKLKNNLQLHNFIKKNQQQRYNGYAFSTYQQK